MLVDSETFTDQPWSIKGHFVFRRFSFEDFCLTLGMRNKSVSPQRTHLLKVTFICTPVSIRASIRKTEEHTSFPFSFNAFFVAAFRLFYGIPRGYTDPYWSAVTIIKGITNRNKQTIFITHFQIKEHKSACWAISLSPSLVNSRT